MLLFCLSELNNNLYLDCLTVGQVVAFTDDGWRANLHGLHLVYDLILFCFSGLFLVFWHLSFGFSMVSGSCQLCLSISLVYIWGYYQFIWDLSALFRSYQLFFICIPVSITLILGPLCPCYWSWVRCVHPYFRFWVQMFQLVQFCPIVLSSSVLD